MTRDATRKEKTDDEPSHPLVGFCTEVVFLILKKKLPLQVLPENKDAGLKKESEGDGGQSDEVELEQGWREGAGKLLLNAPCDVLCLQGQNLVIQL